MRYPPNQREKTHARIVSTASRMLVERGYRGAGVADVMKGAGMTAGGFYAHFASKQALFRESLAAAFRDFRKRLAGEIEGQRRSVSVNEFVRRYFEMEKKAGPGERCPISALAPEVARAGAPVRETFEEELRKTVETVAARIRERGAPPDDAALAILALCSGAILLGRAVGSPEKAERIFEACVRLAGRTGGR